MRVPLSGYEMTRNLLSRQDPNFWKTIKATSNEASDTADLMRLSVLRKKALALKLPGVLPGQNIKIAFLGGCSLYPLHEMVEHLLWVNDTHCRPPTVVTDVTAEPAKGEEKLTTSEIEQARLPASEPPSESKSALDETAPPISKGASEPDPVPSENPAPAVPSAD